MIWNVWGIGKRGSLGVACDTERMQVRLNSGSIVHKSVSTSYHLLFHLIWNMARKKFSKQGEAKKCNLWKSAWTRKYSTKPRYRPTDIQGHGIAFHPSMTEMSTTNLSGLIMSTTLQRMRDVWLGHVIVGFSEIIDQLFIVLCWHYGGSMKSEVYQEKFA